MDTKHEDTKRRLFSLRHSLEQAAYYLTNAADWAALLGQPDRAVEAAELADRARRQQELVEAAQKDLQAQAAGNA